MFLQPEAGLDGVRVLGLGGAVDPSLRRSRDTREPRASPSPRATASPTTTLFAVRVARLVRDRG